MIIIIFFTWSYSLYSIAITKDALNEKLFFYNHRSIIYSLFFEAFIQLDAAKLRNSVKGFGISDYISQDGIASSQREDLEVVLYTLEKILLLLPEILEQRWQINSIVFVFRKMLHYANVWRIRQEGLRLFLVYYQILGEKVVCDYPQIEVLYALLIPGLVVDLVPNLNPRNMLVINGSITGQHLTELPDMTGTGPPPGSLGPVQPFPNEPFIPNLDSQNGPAAQLVPSMIGAVAQNLPSTPPVSSGYPQQQHHHQTSTFEFKPEIQQFFLRAVLEHSISQCGRVAWSDYRDRRAHRAFEYLMSSFSRIYMPYLFPKMAVLINPDRTSSTPKTWPVYTVHPIISVYSYGGMIDSKIPILRRHADHMRQYFIYSQQSPTPVLNPIVHLQTIVIQWFTKYLLDPERNTDHNSTLVSGSYYSPTSNNNSASSTLTQDGVGGQNGKISQGKFNKRKKF